MIEKEATVFVCGTTQRKRSQFGVEIAPRLRRQCSIGVTYNLNCFFLKKGRNARNCGKMKYSVFLPHPESTVT